MEIGDFRCCMQIVNQGKALVFQAGMQGGDFEFILMNFEGEVHHLKTEYAEAHHIQEVILQQISPKLSPVAYAYALINIVSFGLVIGASMDIVYHDLQAAMVAIQNAQLPWCHESPGFYFFARCVRIDTDVS
jgi:hypothetical protein